MPISKATHEGYLMVDHRGSPGVPRETALRMGINPEYVAEGTLFEAATMLCNHCGRGVIRNPDRTRSRAWCSVCDMYICDDCEAARQHPDYQHFTYRQLAELVGSGKYEIRGPKSRPQVILRQGA